MGELTRQTKSDVAPVTVRQLRAAIPKDCFKKSLTLSFLFLLRDFLILAACIAAYPYIKASYVGLFAYWNIAGFFMWCLFVTGHDCGHGSFSDSTMINDVLGHICHAPLLVPYYPWRLSHRLHHANHNHITKDKSHPWWTPEMVKSPFAIYVPRIPVLYSCIGYAVYLLVGHDGSHFWPYSALYDGQAPIERTRCVVSAISVVIFLSLALPFCQYDFATFSSLYLGPYFVFSFWLHMVTYMQHHDEAHEHEEDVTIVYSDEDWTYLKGALQTVDRSYTPVIDHLHHHITDGHLVHHLFPKDIPHYNLPKATKEIVKTLEKTSKAAGMERSPYKYHKNYLFFYDYLSTFLSHQYFKWAPSPGLQEHLKKDRSLEHLVAKAHHHGKAQ